MENKKLKLLKLFQKYKNGTASQEEMNQFISLMANDESFDNLTVLENYRKSLPHSVEESPLEWKDLNALIQNEQAKNQSHSHVIKLWIRIAASLLLLIGSVFLFNKFTSSVQTFKTRYGEMKRITLNDQSTLIIGPNSKVVWDRKWQKLSERSVQMEGEVYFDISTHYDSKDQKIPFIVETKHLEIAVKGTQFNVNQQNDKTEIYLNEGAIEVKKINENPLHSRIQKMDDKIVKMMPGDFLNYDSDTPTLLVESNLQASEQYTKWTDGIIEFDDEELNVVMKKIKEIYGKELILEDEILKTTRVTVGLPIDNWKMTKSILERTFSINKENGKFIIQNQTK